MKNELSRRDFLKYSGLTAAVLAVGVSGGSAFGKARSASAGKKVIIIGIDGMDPRLCEKMMDEGRLANFDRLRKDGGYRRLGTTTPPQSPVAWASFINGAGPGSHGIFDFIHRNPDKQAAPFYSAAETLAAEGHFEIGDHQLQLPFWPFKHKASETLLRRKGVPFWDYLDAAGINSVFYDLPSNYPPSPSKHGNHKCLSGMGTPDMLGTYGTYQYYSEDGPLRPIEEGGGRRSLLYFSNEKASGKLIGPPDSFLKSPKPTDAEFDVYRDLEAGAAAIEVQGQKILLKEGQWSDWVKVEYTLSMPAIMPDKTIGGICRFYLQEISPNFSLYVSPINIDPSSPAVQVTEPKDFVEDISKDIGLFYTTGFQEDHKALSNKIFSDDDYTKQARLVLDDRMRLLKYATDNYDDGLLFFYFSSTDMQAHMLWWDSEKEHPTRSKADAAKYFEVLKDIYAKMDVMLGEMLEKYSDEATIMVMSDHGFANFKRQFGLNAWLCENGYINKEATSVLGDIDWSTSRAYGLGINGLYLNLKGRERDGIVSSAEREKLLDEISEKLLAVRDVDGAAVITNVTRTDKAFKGGEMEFAPDLIVGYNRDYRASWGTCLGTINEDVLSDNESAWAADHCADAKQVPGVLFANRPIAKAEATIMDLAPTVLEEYGMKVPITMQGSNIF